jgi:hypothetical protein
MVGYYTATSCGITPKSVTRLRIVSQAREAARWTSIARVEICVVVEADRHACRLGSGSLPWGEIQRSDVADCVETGRVYPGTLSSEADVPPSARDGHVAAGLGARSDGGSEVAYFRVANSEDQFSTTTIW